MTRGQVAAVVGGGLLVFGVAFGIGFAQTRGRSHPPTNVVIAGSAPTAAGSTAPTPTTATSTTAPCSLSLGSGTVPVSKVCSPSGAPHFDTPQAAMVYLAAAWNNGDVQKIDYVTDPAGRQQLDAMAAQMANLQFKSCSGNPTGDYTCYFMHDIAPSTSATTYPNPGGYPPGEAVFTVAPANGPGWYLTFVIHCG